MSDGVSLAWHILAIPLALGSLVVTGLVGWSVENPRHDGYGYRETRPVLGFLAGMATLIVCLFASAGLLFVFVEVAS